MIQVIKNYFNYSRKLDSSELGIKGMYHMDNNKTVGIEQYANLLEQIATLLNFSLPEIRKKYANYPICLIDYIEKGIEEKSIEIRFDKEEVTISCTFNSAEICDSVFLFPDKEAFIGKFVFFLKETYEYDFIQNRWKTSEYFIKIKEISQSENDVCFLFYA